jgi:coenzyme F420-dependent glucose-6-phosphate dehydrogenase
VVGAGRVRFYTEDWHDPQAMYERGEEKVSDDDLKESFIIASDPETHVERIREVVQMGASTVVLMNNSGADPHGAIDTYRESVLPKLKG